MAAGKLVKVFYPVGNVIFGSRSKFLFRAADQLFLLGCKDRCGGKSLECFGLLFGDPALFAFYKTEDLGIRCKKRCAHLNRAILSDKNGNAFSLAAHNMVLLGLFC